MLIALAILISIFFGLVFSYGVSVQDQGNLFFMGTAIFVLGAIALAFRPQLRRREKTKKGESDTPLEESPFHLTIEERQFLTRLFFVALGIRVAVSILFCLADRNRFLDSDGHFAERVGFVISEYWQGRGPGWYRTAGGGEIGFYYINAVIFFIFGKFILLPKILNSIIGSLVCVFIYRIAKVCFNARIARLAAWLAVFFPSMITWSCLNVKDMYVIFLMLIVVFQAMKLRDEVTLGSVLTIIVSLSIMRTMRNYLPFLIVSSLGMSFFVLSQKHIIRNYILGLFLLLGIIFQANLSGFKIVPKETLNLEKMQNIRGGMSKGRKAASYYSAVDISTPGGAVAFLPIGMAYFLFSPFPWAIDPTRIRQLLSIPELLIWYALIPSLLRGLRYGARRNFYYSSILYALILPMILAYSLAEGNVGTAFRHRAQVMVFLLIFAAAGWIIKHGGDSSLPISEGEG